MRPGLADPVVLEHLDGLGRPVLAAVLDVGVFPADVLGVGGEPREAYLEQRLLEPQLVRVGAAQLHQVHMRVRGRIELERPLTELVLDERDFHPRVLGALQPRRGRCVAGADCDDG